MGYHIQLQDPYLKKDTDKLGQAQGTTNSTGGLSNLITQVQGEAEEPGLFSPKNRKMFRCDLIAVFDSLMARCRVDRETCLKVYSESTKAKNHSTGNR